MSPNTLSRTVRIRRRISVAAVAATCLTAMIGSPATTATAAAVEPSFAAVSAAASLTGTQLRAEIARVARTQVGYTGSARRARRLPRSALLGSRAGTAVRSSSPRPAAR